MNCETAGLKCLGKTLNMDHHNMQEEVSVRPAVCTEEVSVGLPVCTEEVPVGLPVCTEQVPAGTTRVYRRGATDILQNF